MKFEIRGILQIIKKRLWLIVILPVLLGGIMAYYSYNKMRPVYSANTTLYVINQDLNPQDAINQSALAVAQLLVNDYRELILSRYITTKVADELKYRNLGNISVNAKPGSRVFAISVLHNDPIKARDVANKLSEVFKKEIVNIMKVENISIIDKAETPRAPISPQPKRNTAVAVIVGVFLALGISAIWEYFDTTIKTLEDVEKHLGLEVVGTIPVLNIK